MPRPGTPGVVGGSQADGQREALEQALGELADANAELARRESFTDALLETIEVGIISCDAQGVFVVSNRAERAMFGLQSGLQGLSPDQLDPLIDVFDADGRRLAVQEYPLMRALRGEDVSSVDVIVGPAGGPYREVVVRGSQITGSDGDVLGAVAALTDVTAERTASRALTEERRNLAAAEKSAQRANAFFDAVLTATSDYTFVIDLATGTVTYASRSQDVLGVAAEELNGVDPAVDATRIHPDDQLRLRAVIAAAGDLADGQLLQIRYRGMNADGQWRWFNRRLTPFRRDSTGTVVEALGVVRDVTDLVQAEDQLTYAALHDSLTGLPNRALLVDRLEAALTRSRREEREVAVLFFDLDGFKRVNDTGGHAAGDAVLLEVARRLTGLLRTDDTVARVGGDEFVIVVEPWNRIGPGEQMSPHYRGAEPVRSLAARVAERVAATLRQPIIVGAVEHVVTASIGITYARLAPDGNASRVTADQVLQDADTAMYRAKGRGKDRVEVFPEDLRHGLPESRHGEPLDQPVR